jgi:predicted nuclease with TOPRIM domain
MKLVKDFTDLGKANDYITGLNEAFTAGATETQAALEKSKLLQESLTKEQDNSTELSKKIEAITLEKNTLESSLTASRAETNEALTELTELSAKLDLQEKYGKDGLVVMVGKKSFKLEGDSFIYGGAIHTAEQLSKDKTQLAKMVESGSGSLVEITK